MKAHLLASGYPERNIVLLTDQEAGKAGLEKYLDDGQAYLVPWDGDPKFLANTGYPVKRLYERLNALKAGRVLDAPAHRRRGSLAVVSGAHAAAVRLFYINT